MVTRVLPLLYCGVGYLALPIAFAAVAYQPRSLAGFYYHPRLIGVVHLVTLGWITATILGLLHLALRTPLQPGLSARRGDFWALAAFVVGLIGMVIHFWIQEFSGMAWSGAMVAAAVLHVGLRVVPSALTHSVPAGITLPIVFAFANLVVAASAGVVLGFDKVYQFLPGYVLSNVLAHAHLAALGWASMMTLALGYMTLPAVPAGAPSGRRSMVITAVLLEIAALGLAASLLFGSRWSALFVGVAAVAFLRFAGDVWRSRRSDVASPRPGVAAWHVYQALLYLAAALVLGAALTLLDASEATARLALVYGVCGLVGFLAQMVMGIQMRLVSMAAPDWGLALPAFVMWSAAVPLLAAGFWTGIPLMLSAGGAAGCVATVATGVQGLLAISSRFSGPRWISWKRDGRNRRRAAQQLALPQGRA